jgi:predicted nicotinamide N-methyase
MLGCVEYQLSRQKETFDGVALEIECLESLDRTIDELFVHLEKTGNPALLEELCPYFGTLWPAARALAGIVSGLGGAGAIQGKRVLEVGCGLAVPSLVAAKLGALVKATDFHPEVPIFLRRNLALNGLAELEYVRVDWSRGGSGYPDLGQFDYVIGSDVLYEKTHAASLSSVIDRYLSPKGLAVITDPARPYLQGFIDEMSRKGFRHESSVSGEIFVVKLARKTQGG